MEAVAARQVVRAGRVFLSSCEYFGETQSNIFHPAYARRGSTLTYAMPQSSLAINEGSVAQLLDTEESRRWRRFAFYEDAQRFLAGRAFLRIALGAVLGVPPRELAFSTGAFGKPTLAATGSDTLRFSLSRTSHAIALALAWGVDVGGVTPIR